MINNINTNTLIIIKYIYAHIQYINYNFLLIIYILITAMILNNNQDENKPTYKEKEEANIKIIYI